MLKANALLQNGNYEKYYTATFFDAAVFEKAEILFDEYRSNGVILNDSFFDQKWKLTNQLCTVAIDFNFSEVQYRKNTMPWIGCGYAVFTKSVKGTSKNPPTPSTKMVK